MVATGIRKFLIGKPLPTEETEEQRLGNFSALAVFASDALSSVAYATEEMLLILILAGPFVLGLGVPVSAAIVVLMIIVTTSYRQTIRAYPSGGGAYTVARENLGRFLGVTAGAALLVDYVLTVAVSVAAGVAAITSAVPGLFGHRVGLAVAAVGIITLGNLRGVRESGKLFGLPAYGFIAGLAVLIVGGLWKFSQPDFEPIAYDSHPRVFHALTALLVLRAFSSGCAALTGIEAVSNGVRAFRPPEADNAARVLRWLTMLLGFLFLGISTLAFIYRVVPDELGRETVVSQLAEAVFGRGPLYYYIQAVTCAILVLAANTSFAGFPRLASVMARDRFLPRQLQNLGDRLVFSNGILLLAGFAGALLVLFQASVHRLIPLYAVGVFLSFTLSQAGMVVHHVRIREPRWKPHLAINLVGALTTAVVLAAILVTKFTHGAWVICLVFPLMISLLYSIHDHYRTAAGQLTANLEVPLRARQHTVIVPVAGMNRGVVTALEYARSLSPRVRAVTVGVDEGAVEHLREQWRKWAPDIPLEALESPYRSLTKPLIGFIRDVRGERPEDLITVVIPSFVPARWWHNFLHNQSAILLQAALIGMRNVVVTSVRIHLDK